jgi:nicotinamidase-related amidase
VTQQPPIPRATTAMVFNDMVNANVRAGDQERTKLVESSGVIDACVHWVAELRTLGIPIFWVRVEQRADGKDRSPVLTDEFIAAGDTYPRPHVKGSFEAQNIVELPVQAEDHEILKPRFSPFAGTDLDIQLRARRIDTILLGGISTYSGVESCARDAYDLVYNVVVLGDLCWGPDRQQHEWALAKRLPRVARVMTTEQARALLV